MSKIINTGAHCAKIKKIDLQKGTVVVRFAWDLLVWRKLKIISVNLFGELIVEPLNVWEKGVRYRILTTDAEKELGEWIPVVTIQPDGTEKDICAAA